MEHAITTLVSDLKDDETTQKSAWVFCKPDFASAYVRPTPDPTEFWKDHNTVLEVVWGEIVGDVAETDVYVGDVGNQLGKRRISMRLPIRPEYLGVTREAFAALTRHSPKLKQQILFSLAMSASRDGDRVAAYHILRHASDVVQRLNRPQLKPPPDFVADFEILKKAIEAQKKAHEGPRR